MTIRELEDALKSLKKYDGFTDDTEVMIGMYQHYGSDFAMSIDEIEIDKGIRTFWGDDIPKGKVIFLIEGSQEGVMDDIEDDDEYDDEYDEDKDEDEDK